MKHTTFPRLKSRGPIEAYFPLSFALTFVTFPRLKSRGPIEAYAAVYSTVNFVPFPRLKSRGPIEASAALSASSFSASCISTAEKSWPH